MGGWIDPFPGTRKSIEDAQPIISIHRDESAVRARLQYVRRNTRKRVDGLSCRRTPCVADAHNRFSTFTIKNCDPCSVRTAFEATITSGGWDCCNSTSTVQIKDAYHCMFGEYVREHDPCRVWSEGGTGQYTG